MGTKNQKKKKTTTHELLVLLLTAAIFAMIVGNVIYYIGDSYLVPGIHLDLLTFITIFGYGLTVFILAVLLRRRSP
jgi:polyferredoxin